MVFHRKYSLIIECFQEKNTAKLYVGGLLDVTECKRLNIHITSIRHTTIVFHITRPLSLKFEFVCNHAFAI